MLVKARKEENRLKWSLGILLSASSEVDYAALQANCNGMSPIVRAKLGEYVCHMALDSCLPD